jgi:hypothetical protein
MPWKFSSFFAQSHIIYEERMMTEPRKIFNIPSSLRP